MKILFYLLMICNSTLLKASHDIPIAIFHIYASENTMQLAITFDVQELSNALKVNTNEITLESIQKYLDTKTTFQFNTKTADLKILTFNIIKDHIRIKGHFDVMVKKVNTLKIENTCLVHVHNHSNIMQVDLHNTKKDYRMHAGRTAISLEY